MYKLIISIFLIFYGASYANAQQTPAQLVASKIANRMKDSLSLTSLQLQKIYEINLSLHNQKMNVRSVYANKPDSIGYYFQRIENTRDSLYGSVLTVGELDLYKQKKRVLIANN